MVSGLELAVELTLTLPVNGSANEGTLTHVINATKLGILTKRALTREVLSLILKRVATRVYEVRDGAIRELIDHRRD